MAEIFASAKRSTQNKVLNWISRMLWWKVQERNYDFPGSQDNSSVGTEIEVKMFYTFTKYNTIQNNIHPRQMNRVHTRKSNRLLFQWLKYWVQDRLVHLKLTIFIIAFAYMQHVDNKVNDYQQYSFNQSTQSKHPREKNNLKQQVYAQ